jgi:L-iditol 2-dehydrogenase
MRAAVLVAPGRLELAEVPEPDPADDALIALERTGICGTDISIFHGKIPVTYPRILGHEMVGRVVRPGSGRTVPVGARVLVNPSVACGQCYVCRADREHLCPNGALVGRDRDGGFVEMTSVDERRLLPIGDDMPLADAALLQVLGTCVHAQSTFPVFPGQTAAVVGLGVAGLLMVQLLRARGVRHLVGVTRAQWKQRLGVDLGATIVVPPEEAVTACADLTGGRGADVVIEAVGRIDTLAQAIRLAGFGATVVAFGTIGGGSGGTAAVPYYDLYYKELTLLNPRAARHRDYTRAIDLVTTGAVTLAPLLSRSFPLESARDAIAAVDDPMNLKVTLDIGG